MSLHSRWMSIATILLALQSAWAVERPNIVLIMADDMGYSDIGCYGGEIQTPNVDALAAGGLRFTQFYNTARCCPTRAALLTGLHQHQTGIGQMTETPQAPRSDNRPAYQGFLNRNCVTMAEVLGTAGYHTYMAGKWHLGYHGQEKWPRQRGFDRFYGAIAGATSFFKPQGTRGVTLDNQNLDPPTDPDYYTTDAFTDYAVQFLNEQQDDAPFFLYLAYTAPHWPLQARPSDVQKYVGKYRDIGWDQLRRTRLAKQKQLGIVDDSVVLPERDEGVRAWDELTDQQRDQLDYRMAVYAAMVDRMDQNIGRVIECLEDQGELDNTLILFLSDNGGCAEPYKDLGGGRFSDINNPNVSGAVSYGQGWANASNTPFRKFKVFSHEGGIATPLIVHWPAGLKTEAGSLTHTPAQLIDVMPTILDVTGATYPNSFAGHDIHPLEGMSLFNTLRGNERDPAEWMYWEHAGHAAVRHGDWKALLPRRDNQWQLYDLSNDRQEQNDLAAAMPDLVAKMSAKWQAWASRVGVTDGKKAAPKGRATAANEKSPRIANHEIELRATVQSDAPHGVVMAHGGDRFGYALHFIDGKPTFDVRLNGSVTRLVSTEAVHGEVTMEASLRADTMTLSVRGGHSYSQPSPGLIPVEPIDGLSIGRDIRTAAGDYVAPNPFNETIIRHRVTTRSRPLGDTSSPIQSPRP
ncbi:MAG: arylsulfatase [Planctomycetota bacterium]